MQQQISKQLMLNVKIAGFATVILGIIGILVNTGAARQNVGLHFVSLLFVAIMYPAFPLLGKRNISEVLPLLKILAYSIVFIVVGSTVVSLVAGGDFDGPGLGYFVPLIFIVLAINGFNKAGLITGKTKFNSKVADSAVDKPAPDIASVRNITAFFAVVGLVGYAFVLLK